MRKLSLYTPTDAEIREAATNTAAGWVDDAYDSWLDAHDAAIRADERAKIAAAIREQIDWSSGRWDYGDNRGYEHAAEIAERAS